MLQKLLDNNKQWAQKTIAQEPDFFKNLSLLQSPEYLWVGCSDSRVPANQITGLAPGEVFVHRNVANIVHHGDLNFNSVLHYAVEVLKVKFVIVCGHYGCGGVRAACGDNFHGVIDHWIQPVRDVAKQNQDLLRQCDNFDDKVDLLCELNVRQQLLNIANNPIIRKAWLHNNDIEIHGWIYRLIDGVIRPLLFHNKNGLKEY